MSELPLPRTITAYAIRGTASGWQDWPTPFRLVGRPPADRRAWVSQDGRRVVFPTAASAQAQAAHLAELWNRAECPVRVTYRVVAVAVEPEEIITDDISILGRGVTQNPLRVGTIEGGRFD